MPKTDTKASFTAGKRYAQPRRKFPFTAKRRFYERALLFSVSGGAVDIYRFRQKTALKLGVQPVDFCASSGYNISVCKGSVPLQ